MLLAAACTSGGAPGGCRPEDRTDVRELFKLRDPVIYESSGVAVSSRKYGDDRVYFTHNDSGDRPRIFALDRKGYTLATISIEGARALDWEDMAAGRDAAGEPALFIADIGDNGATRSSIVVYQVREPLIEVRKRGVQRAARVAARYRLRYSDRAHDAETLLVDPASGRIAIVTKSALGKSVVYATAARPSATGTTTLRRVGSIDFNDLADIGLGEQLRATGGAISRDGRAMVVRTYADAYRWPLKDFDIASALKRAPAHIPLPTQRQGEGIAFTGNDDSFVITSEGARSAVQAVRRVVKRCP